MDNPPATALDAPADRLDDGERWFVEQVREHGWVRTSVFTDDEGPGFSYTTGFRLSVGQPELIMFSVKSEIAHNVFWELFRDLQAGASLQVGARTHDVFANLPAYLLPVAPRHYPTYLGWSRWFYGGDDFPVLQLVWPDPAGLFPWEEDFDLSFGEDQPDLSEQGWAALSSGL